MADEDILWDYALANTIEGRILEAVRDRIRTIGLKCIVADSIVIQKLAWNADESQLPLPCVIISPAAETTNWQAGTNEREEPQFAVMVAIVLANVRNVGLKGMGLQLEWRQELRRSFQNLNGGRFTELADFGDGSMFINGTVESGDKFIEAAKRMQRDAQYFLLRFTVREPRS